MDVSTFRRHALALPEAVEQDHHGFPSFRVRGKIFVTLPDDGHAHLMLDEEQIREAVLLDPACEERWWGTKLAAARVSLVAVADDVLLQLLREAWTGKAPKKLVTSGPGPAS
jgi:hypothetical protein